MTDSAINFAGFTFAADKGCLTCQHVMDGAPVLLFAHEADGDLQFLCGESHHDFDTQCLWLHTSHVLQRQPDLLLLPTVEMGFEAERDEVGSPWIVARIPTYE